jgi:hypothetical protein
MDFSKSGSAKFGKGTPRHVEHNAKGTEKNPYGPRETKAELLARMKTAAQTASKDKKMV